MKNVALKTQMMLAKFDQEGASREALKALEALVREANFLIGRVQAGSFIQENLTHRALKVDLAVAECATAQKLYNSLFRVAAESGDLEAGAAGEEV